jgi:Protein of unknown function (DUF1573)
MVEQVARARIPRLFAAGAGAGMVAALAALVSCVRSQSPPPANSPRRIHQALPLATSPDPILLSGGNEETFSVRNVQAQPIIVDRVEVSCPCVRIGPLPVRIGAGETINLRATFEPSPEDVDFKGTLLVIITGYAADASVAFQMHARIDCDALGIDVIRPFPDAVGPGRSGSGESRTVEGTRHAH